MASILIGAGQQDLGDTLATAVNADGHVATLTSTHEDFVNAFKAMTYDVYALDYYLNPKEFHFVIEALKETHHGALAKTIILIGNGELRPESVRTAARLMKPYQVLSPPVRPEDFAKSVASIVAET